MAQHRRLRDTGKLTGERKRVDVLSVVGAGHELLTQTDGVLALGNTVEFFKFFFRDALQGN
jgi:hypothetical protein